MSWYHAHIYFNTDDDSVRRAEDLWRKLGLAERYPLEYRGEIERRIVGPHPLPQFEVHFREKHLWDILPKLHGDRDGLSILVHPVTPNDHEDHFTSAIWLGEPFRLDATKLDPPGMNKAFFRLGKEQFSH
ncbi:MAG TPA: DOPA 4,5-dioxygenase family protein [Bdellovibrionota bacterium]|jgi:DOPA 4,5-dioxygenase|nr:DOPA 4,5-dioxygenase family protein [Bdellovibrionota bacterium]